MSIYDGNDPATVALRAAPASKGFTDQDRVELVDLVREISRRDFDQGVSKMPTVAVESIFAIAIREREEARRLKAAAPVFAPEVLKRKISAKAAFGKASVLPGVNTSGLRAAHLKEFGAEAYAEDKAAWHVGDDLRVAGVNPDKGDRKLKKAIKALNNDHDTDWMTDPKHLGVPVQQLDKTEKKKERTAKSTNPYLWPEDHPQRLSEIARVMGRMPTKFVSELAKAAGCTISGQKIVAK